MRGILKSAHTYSGAIWWEATDVLVNIKKTLIGTTKQNHLVLKLYCIINTFKIYILLDSFP